MFVRTLTAAQRDNEISALIYYKVHYKQLFIVSACLLIRRAEQATVRITRALGR